MVSEDPSAILTAILICSDYAGCPKYRKTLGDLGNMSCLCKKKDQERHKKNIFSKIQFLLYGQNVALDSTDVQL